MSKIYSLAFLGAVLSLGYMSSCKTQETDSIEAFKSQTHTIQGKAEKGPMVRGSSVELRSLDASLLPTGQSYTETINNNLGDFSFESRTLNSPYAELTADGFFFNETTGKLSMSPIKLKALVDLSDQSTINVNILTHLKAERVRRLVKDQHLSFGVANKQAQQELLKLFGLQAYADKDVSQFSILKGDDASAALVAVSSLLLFGKSEAELTEFLSTLSEEFASQADFSPQTKDKLKETKNKLGEYHGYILDSIPSYVEQRYKSLGYEIKVKDIRQFIDWNDDGIAGNDVEGRDKTIQLTPAELMVPKEGGEFKVQISSDKPIFFLDDFAETNSKESISQLGALYGNSEEDRPLVGLHIESKSIKNGVITLKVSPAHFVGKVDSVTLSLYDVFRRDQVAELKIKQAGDPSFKLANRPPLNYYSYGNSLYNMNKSLSYKVNGHLYNSNLYVSIRSLAELRPREASALGVYQAEIETAISFLYMVEAYYSRDVYLNPREAGWDKDLIDYLELEKLKRSHKQIFQYIQEKLEKALPLLHDTKYSEAEPWPTKDIGRILLAHVYRVQGKYIQAIKLLEEVISKGHYQLTQSPYNYVCPSEECIYFYRGGGYSWDSFFPILDYKDLYLDLAECYYHAGEDGKAKQTLDHLIKTKQIKDIQDTNLLLYIGKIREKYKTPFFAPFVYRNKLTGEFSVHEPR